MEEEDVIAPAEELKNVKNDVETLKIRCNALEKAVKKLESVADTHERLLEAYRQEITRIHRDQGVLDLTYEREKLELMGSNVTSDTVE